MSVLTSPSHGVRRLGLWTALLSVVMLAAAGPAGAIDTPTDFSAGDQYVETLPTANGPRATDRKPKHRRAALAPGIQHRLAQQGGSSAATLEAVATSPELGAPAPSSGPGATGSNGGSGSGSGGGRRHGGKGSGESTPSVPSAAIKAASGTGTGLGWLALGLPLITAAALGVFGFQRHRNRNGSS
jgi:hypothetical protein